MSNQKRPRGRPPKYPRDVVRDRLIDAAIEALLETGIDAGLESVALDAAIINAGVPRGMAYKIWQDSDRAPQDALRHSVVVRLLNLPTLTGLDATWERFEQELSNLEAPKPSDSPERRREVMSELVRVVGSFNHETLDSSREWRLYNAIRAASLTQPQLDPEIMTLLEEGENRIIERYAKLYEAVSDSFGAPLSENFTIYQFSAAVYALNEGLSSRLSTSYERTGITRVNAAGKTQEWTLFSIGFEALIYKFFDL